MQVTPEHQNRFAALCERDYTGREPQGIGTLGERTLHAMLKEYCAPDRAFQEVRIHGYVADIATPQGITEIQTREFYRLRKKLEAFLPHGPVTVVYPVARVKWLVWVDPETGEASPRRKSPKRGAAMDILHELYALKGFLGREGLCFQVFLVDLEEIRLLDGWGKGGKRGSTRSERLPRGLGEVVSLRGPEDYRGLLPQGLDREFTSKDFAKAASRSVYFAQRAVSVLAAAGAIEPCGKRSRCVLYRCKSAGE